MDLLGNQDDAFLSHPFWYAEDAWDAWDAWEPGTRNSGIEHPDPEQCFIRRDEDGSAAVLYRDQGRAFAV